MQEKFHEKYEFTKTQEILGQDLEEGLRILEEIYKWSLWMKDLEWKENPSNILVKGAEWSVPWLDVCKICAKISKVVEHDRNHIF